MDAIITEIVRRDLQTPVLAMRPLTGGAQNIVYRADTAQGNYVLRLNRGFAATYARERWAMQQAAAAGVAVPFVQALGSEGGYDYMLMHYVPGTLGTDYRGDRAALYRTLGDCARRLASLSINGYGRNIEFLPGPKFTNTWAEAMDADEAYIFGDGLLQASSLLDTVKTGQVRGFMRECREWTLPPCLSHNDICLDNVIISNDGLIYLIDWSNVRAQPGPWIEIARVASATDPECLAAFVEGWGITGAEWQANADLVERLKLVHRLRAVAWAMRDAPHLVEGMITRTKGFVEGWK